MTQPLVHPLPLVILILELGNCGTTGPTTGGGGNIFITSGDTAEGGNIQIRGGTYAGNNVDDSIIDLVGSDGSFANTDGRGTGSIRLTGGNNSSVGPGNSAGGIVLTGGNNTGGGTGGQIIIETGEGTSASADMTIRSGPVTGAKDTGNINIFTEQAPVGNNSGDVNISSGTIAGAGNTSGDINLTTGDETFASSGDIGSINIITGNSTGSGDSGAIVISCGTTVSGTGGSITIRPGDSTAGTDGDVEFDLHSGTSMITIDDLNDADSDLAASLLTPPVPVGGLYRRESTVQQRRGSDPRIVSGMACAAPIIGPAAGVPGIANTLIPVDDTVGVVSIVFPSSND